MARDSTGPKGEPQYSGSGVPQDAADLTEVAAYAAEYGNYRADTSAVRNAATGTDVWPGLIFYETDTGVTYRYGATGWEFATTIAPRLRMQRPLAGISATTWMSVSMATSAQEGGGGFTGGAGSFGVPVTGRYAVSMKCTVPTTAAGNRRMLGISTQAAVGTPIAQSPGFGAPNDNSGFGIEFLTEVTLQAGTQYVVSAYSTAPLNFSNFDVSVRLIAPTSIG